MMIWLVVKKTILKNDGVRQWGWDDIPYMKWKIKFHGSKPPIISYATWLCHR